MKPRSAVLVPVLLLALLAAPSCDDDDGDVNIDVHPTVTRHNGVRIDLGSPSSNPWAWTVKVSVNGVPTLEESGQLPPPGLVTFFTSSTAFGPYDVSIDFEKLPPIGPPGQEECIRALSPSGPLYSCGNHLELRCTFHGCELVPEDP